MATPVASVTPSRTSGVAPLCVTFDATGTTDADVSNAFRDLVYMWNFGDSSDGTWDNGANTSISKNQATGAIAGHVYETAGTYTWTLVVWDGTTADVETGTITVTNPDTVFSTTNTVVVSTGSDFTGAPAGATQVTSSDFDATIGTYVGTGKRVLFKRGDTFAASAASNVSAAGAITIGAWGSGALPIVTSTNIAGVLNINNAAVNDLRIMDLDIRGNGATDTGVGIRFTADVANVCLLRVKISEIGYGFNLVDSVILTGGVIQECTVNNYYVGNAFYGRLATSAILGNALGPAGAGAEHVLRIQRGNKFAVVSNTLSGPRATKSNLTIRADVGSASTYGYVSDNKMISALNQVVCHIAPTASTQNNDISDVIAERNYTTSGAATTTGFYISATRVTVRNNVIDLSGGSFPTMANVYYDNTAGAPVPDNVRIQNNTAYSSDAVDTFYGVIIDTEPTNTVVINNLVYAPTAPSGDMIAGTGTTPGAQTNNSSDAQIVNTSPQFVGPLTSPIGFRISAASYGDAGGTAAFPAQKSDFFNGRDNTGDNRIGACVTTANVQCLGVAR